MDSSSGAIGAAVNKAIRQLVPIVSAARADVVTRNRWLERLWEAYQEDEIPYLEMLGDRWGELCASREVAAVWADRLVDGVRSAWSLDPARRGWFKGTTNCLSAMLAAGRHQELLDLLEAAPDQQGSYEDYAARARAAIGRAHVTVRHVETNSNKTASAMTPRVRRRQAGPAPDGVGKASGPDLSDWPRSWMGTADDLPAGREIVAVFRPFIEYLLEQQLSPRTVRRHIDNLWSLGGELVRDLNLTAGRKNTQIERLVFDFVEEGGPLLPGSTQEEMRSFESTCRKFRRFLERAFFPSADGTTGARRLMAGSRRSSRRR